MTNESRIRDKLDDRYCKILLAIDEMGGTASTTEIKRLTGIEVNQIITQRMDRLQDLGLITTSYKSDPNRPEQIPTKVASFTKKGRQLANSGLLDDLTKDEQVQSVSQLNNRVERLERRLDALRDEVSEFIDTPENDGENTYAAEDNSDIWI